MATRPKRKLCLTEYKTYGFTPLNIIMQNRIAVSTTSSALNNKALQLAETLGLHFVPHLKDQQTLAYDYLLLITPDYIGLWQPNDKKINPFYIDFLSGKIRYRSQRAGLRNELLARAIGSHPRDNPIIVDATAGLGQDSFILATLGFHVIMLERSPILYILLEDAINRAKMDLAIGPIVKRLQFIQTDAVTWLKAQSAHQKPDIIYLDPMFPEKQKSASAKKEMVILQDLLGKDTDSDILFQVALSCATGRVVVKRPRLAKNMAACAPDFSQIGTSNRFDVYIR